MFTFSVPDHYKPWSTNRSGQMHWGTRRTYIRAWRDAATQACEMLRMGPRKPSTVRVTIPFERRARRDPHNYVGTVCKAIVDGIVRAGVFPDDTPEWVTVAEPELVVGQNLPVVVTLEDRDGS